MDDLVKALKFYFFGIFLYLVLIEVVGFLSPFYALVFYSQDLAQTPRELAEQSFYLLGVAQDILPLFSLLYLPGAFYLTRIQSVFGKIVTWVISVTAVFTSLVYLIPTNDQYLQDSLYSISGLFDLILVSIILFVSYRYLSSKIEDKVV